MLVRTAFAALVSLLATVLATVATAGPALLFEASTGKVLYAEDQDQPWFPASLTKIMTAYLTFEALKAGRIKLDQKIAVSEKAHEQTPSKIGLAAGAELTVELSLKALIVKSANDAAIMLAEVIAGSDEAFARMMNDTARRLGMSRTHFVNPNGLPASEQITTARDLAKLSSAVIRDFPEYQPLWQLAEMQIGKNRLRSHNALLRTYEGADGLKTGFICDAGFNVVASATRDGRRLVAVVLGEASGRDRSVRAASLLEHGFQTYDWKQIFNTTTIDSLPMSDPGKVVSIRKSVVSWDCGGPRPRVAVTKRAKPKADETATAAKKTKSKVPAKAARAAAEPATASGTAAAKGKTKATTAKAGLPAKTE